MEELKIRRPVVAGQFYLSSSQGLKKQIEALIDKNAPKSDITACMLPHAGYMYSGAVAGQTISRVNLRDKIILLGPNHTGLGAPFSIMTEGTWQTPLGEIKIDNALAKQILNHSQYLEDDPMAHLHEHSLEVELPFLQYFKTDFKIVPIVILSDNLDTLKKIGKDLASAIEESKIKDSVTIIASSDMTHYESQVQAEKKDKEAIQAILGLNEDKLMERIQRLDISMCGYAPVVVMLSAAKALGATKANLIKYQTSGDITGEKDSVVGYAGIIIY